ncbi:cadherin domain-containing protein [Alteriqipengyuania sp. 357]
MEFAPFDALFEYAEGIVEGLTTIDGGQLGIALGAVLGRRLTDDPFGQIGASAVLKTGLGALGEFVDKEIFGSTTTTTNFLGGGLDGLVDALGKNVISGGVGALSSYLTAQLIDAVGLDGVPGELANSVGGAVINNILSNIAGNVGSSDPVSIFNGVGSASQITNAVGSYIGSKLASEIKTFETVGGQIGSAVGGIYAGFASTVALASLQGVAIGTASFAAVAKAAAAFAAANPIIAVAVVAVVTIVDTLLGGLIGSIFGGTPRSGADVVWNESEGRFQIANVYARKGGSKQAAQGLAEAVSVNFNAVLQAAGGKLLDPGSVQTGNYGMRKRDYVYRPYSTTDKDAISAKFSGNNGAEKLIAHGTFLGLADIDGAIVGGDIYVKRALGAGLANHSGPASGFSMDTLLGDIIVAQEYARFLEQKDMIGAFLSAAPESTFAASWLVTLTRAAELGLHKRSATDWTGGFTALLDELADGVIDGVSVHAASVGARFDATNNERLWSVSDANGYFLGYSGDTIDLAGQTTIEGSAASDTIVLTRATSDENGNPIARGGAQIANTAGLIINNAAADGSREIIGVSAVIRAGAGNDVVRASDLGDTVFGEDGNDTLYGGRLDDWLLGGDGNDRLDAGAQNGGLGGDGNYLNGGAGEDELYGREGSDWLEGGDGADKLYGGDGDDVLSGGAGEDEMRGGGGNDTYLFRRGDGADQAQDKDDSAPSAPALNPADFPGLDIDDPIAARFAAIARGSLKRDWSGRGALNSNGRIAGGEDAVAFGYGIGIGDIRLSRSVDGKHLIIDVMEIGPDGAERPTGDTLTLRGWFSDPFKRVEWLKFVDGNEIRIGDITSFVIGTGGDDVLIGTNGNDFVYGGPGDDKLYLLAGNDVGNGGTGNDMVAGDDGRDLVIGGLGDDRLMGGRGADAITGDDGADDIYGGDDDDVIAGGRGDGDLLVGGAGNDTFKYSRGDGHDTAFDDYAASWQVVWTKGVWNTGAGYTFNPTTGEVKGPGNEVIYKNLGTAAEPRFDWVGRFDFDATTGQLKRFVPPANGVITRDAGEDTIEFGLGINIQDIVLQRQAGSNDLVLRIGDENAESAASSDSLTLKNWYLAPGGIEKLAFYNTGILEIDPSKRRLIAGTEGADGTMATPLSGSAMQDWITGGGGDDIIASGDGDDILAGNAGFDTLKGEAGNDVLYGGAGNDILDGGLGRDILIGGTGQDAASYASSAVGVKVHLSAMHTNTGEASGDEFDSIEDLIGSAGIDELGGDDGDNELTGGRGNDLLTGNTGDDSYVWNIGDGADVIAEGAFVVEEAVTPDGTLADGYLVSRWQATGAIDPGSGWRYWQLQVKNADGLVVYDSSAYLYPSSSVPTRPLPTAYIQSGWLHDYVRTSGQQTTRQSFDASIDGGDDTLEFGKGITLDQLSFGWSGQNLVISHLGQAGSSVTLRGQSLAKSAVESVLLSDGFAFSLASIVFATGDQLRSGTSSGDLMLGRYGAFADQLSGGAGDDVLAGYAGNDTLSGGAGNDVIEGGAGADIIDGGADDGGAGDTVRYVGSAAGVTVDLTLAGAQGGVTGSDAFGDVLSGIESIVGSGFADTLTGNAGNNRLFGLGGNDIINGGGGDDVIVGDDGNDTLRGEDGADSLSGGDGADNLYGGNDNDVLDGGAGDDTLYGDDGDDQLSGGEGVDFLRGGNGKDVLVGGDGNDRLIGDAGDDTLVGGAGTDQLEGGTGIDTYHFDRFSGVDTIIDTSVGNLVTFDGSVAIEELWFARSGSDLRISVIGGDTAITMRDFFVSGGQARIHSVQTASHAIFLDHPDALALIDAMTAAGGAGGGAPSSMPSNIAALLAKYWHAGGKAAPVAPDAPRTASLAEDTSIILDGNYGVVDHDRNIVSYAVAEGAGPKLGALSNFDPATGAFTYTPFPDVNGDDAFSLIATDADGQAVEVRIELRIAAVNDAPRLLKVGGNGVLSVNEGAPGGGTIAGTLIGVFSAVDVEGEEVRYSLVDTLGGRFSLLPNGELRVANPALLDREAAATHTIQVVATDPHGAKTTGTFTVALANVNEAPDKPVATASLAMTQEHVAGTTASNLGVAVATFALTDVDGGATPSLRFTSGAQGNPGNRFKIVGNRVEFNGEPDFETLAAQGFTIADSDGDGFGEVTLTGSVESFDGQLASGQSTTFSIRIEDVNQRQTAIALTGKTASIAERDRVASGTARPTVILGTVAVTDPDLPGQLAGQQVFAVFENGSTSPSTRFAVDSANRLVLLANQSLDYETDGATISLTIRATDKSSAPLSFEQAFSFAIANEDDIVEGTSAANVLTGQQNRDIIRGLAGNDTLSGLDGNDDLDGGDGNDILYGGAGNDLLLGGSGNDRLEGEAGTDTLYGGAGDDLLDGGDGNDILYGEAGNEGTRASGTDPLRGFTAAGLSGGAGNDLLDGGDGDDYLDGGAGADQLIGGAGFDGVTYAGSTAAVNVNLTTGIGAGGFAQGDTLSGIELVEGSSYNDTITGSAGDDVLSGGGGNDTIYGGAGDDHLLGGAGNDTLDAQSGDDYLDGGIGDDILIGGTGNDTYFVARGQGNDRIRNFDATGTDFDHLTLDGSILYSDIWFERVGSDLRLKMLGTAGVDGTVTVEGWFNDPARGDFKIDLISDGVDRAAIPVNVDALVALMASIPSASRPTTQAQMASLRGSDPSFRNGLEDHWGRLGPPKISNTVSISGTEALDNGVTTVSFAVRAWFDDEQGLGVTIPASNIDLSLYTSGGQTLSDYVTGVNYGSPDANGNRTVTLTLAPNASTHLLPGGTLPLQLRAQIRGTNRTALDAGGIALSIAPTADNGSFTQLASIGGAAGSNIALSVAATSPDTDGSEAVDVLVKGLPSGYSLVNASGVATGTYESASGWWRLTTAQLSGLKLKVPAGRHENAALSFAVQTRDGASVRTSGWTALSVVVHGKPTDISLAGSVAENAATGTLVGLLSAIDPDTAEGAAAPTSFQLINSAGGRYVLDPANTRRLLVNNGGGNLDFEASNRDAANTITVRVFDAEGNYFDKAIVVPVTNVNEQNAMPASYAWTVNENSAVGTVVGTVAATDPDPATIAFGQQRYYFLNGTTASASSSDGRYQIDAITGRITTKAALNFEAGTTSVGYTVIARDNAGAAGYTQTQSTVTIGINNLNEQNALPASYSLNVDENSAVGTVVGTVAATDPDSATIAFGQQRYYFLNAGTASATSSDGRYQIDAVTGRITTKAALNFEAGTTSVGYTVIARDNAGAAGYTQTQSTVTIGINNVNEQNALAAITAKTVMENSAAGTLVTTVTATDPDSSATAFGQQRYYFMNGSTASGTSADGRYAINATTGAITTRAVFDYEAGSSQGSYTVAARDNAGAAGYTQSLTTFAINIGDVDELHTMLAGTGSIMENIQAAPNVVHNPSFDLKTSMLRDPEGRAMTWSFADGSTESGIWRISSDGKLMLKAGIADYEAVTTRYEERWVYPGPIGGGGGNPRDPLEPLFPEEPLDPYVVYVPVRDHSLATQALSIRATDTLGRSVTGTFTAKILDENEGPNITSARTFYVNDDQKVGYIGRIGATDPETGAAATSYQIVGFSMEEVGRISGGSSDIDNTGYPYVTVVGSGSSAGNLYFSLPGDGEWEGGIKNHPTLGGRWSFQLNYLATIRSRDAAGAYRDETVTIKFKRHNTSAVLPIVFDLDGDGIELVALDGSTIAFDMDKDGLADKTGWVSADDALLALDRNGNGVIDDSSEISFADDVENALTDLEGLRAFDTNGNGLLDAGDQRFGEFLVWQDINQNGVSDEGELRTLTEAGIVQVNLTLNQTGEELAESHNVIYATTEYLKSDGSTGVVGDTSFAFEPSAVEDEDVPGLPDDVALEWVSVDGVVHTEAGEMPFQNSSDPSNGDESGEAENDGNGADAEDYALAAPVVLDFDGDGSGLVSLAKGSTLFDQDGDGELERTGWIASGDALLALDRNGNGKIDDIGEISFLDDKEGAKTDLEGLAAFDSNGDGLLDASDARFVEFKLWFDRDSDGVTDAGELLSLAEAGIGSISLVGTATGETVTAGSNIVYNRAQFTRADGTVGAVLDAGFAYVVNSSTHKTALTGADDAELEFRPAALTFDRKAKKYRVASMGGELAIMPRKANGDLDARAGAVGPFSEIRLSDRRYGYLDAIVLDLDRDGIETRRFSKTKARFDMNGDGVVDDTGWTTSRDGFLVIDRNDNGRIDDGSELSFYLDAPEARSAMQGLAAFDSNGDGLVSILDKRFGELKIWVDADDDGHSDAGELRSLADHGIVSIRLRANASQNTDKVGRNVLLSTAVFNRADGSTGTMGDVAFGFVPSRKPATSVPNGHPQGDRLRDYPHNELTLQDILSDDFFSRYEAPARSEGSLDAPVPEGFDRPALNLSELENYPSSDRNAKPSEVRALFAESKTPSAMAPERGLLLKSEEMASEDSDISRRLAILRQDMAAFGPLGGLEDQQRDRHAPYALADIYS